MCLLNSYRQVPMSLQILQLLLVIADGLGRQLPHLTVETVLSNSIRKVHTKTPFFRLFTVGKRGYMFIVPESYKVLQAYRPISTFYVPGEPRLISSALAKPCNS